VIRKIFKEKKKRKATECLKTYEILRLTRI
jgi:hypothetical protein